MKSLLEGVGFQIFEAGNGQEALEAFARTPIDFIWMDMRMPVMDGYEAVQKIRQHPDSSEIPIVAITASVFKRQRQRILAAGCNDMVFKPFQAHEIFETMTRLLGVEYIYADPEDDVSPSKAELTATMLAELPLELRRELDKTTLVANREAIFEVIERIEGHSPDLAHGLRTLVQNFEIDRIRELLTE